MTRFRRWWSRRTLRFRITLVVGVVALVALLALSRLGAGLLGSTLVGAADVELRSQAQAAAQRLRDGAAPDTLQAPIRLVDTAGAPVDGRGPLPLRTDEIRELAGGATFNVLRDGQARRWLAVPVVLPDGTTRLVVTSGDLIGGATLLARAAVGFLLGALLVAGIIALAAWVATRAALRPVDRMRGAAAALPPGQRLPVTVARDELRALAEEINSLLARRDDAVARLERFTGDAAHELRSPVASIRVQAEVAVAHPDPELADETLRSIASEAQRLSTLLSDLLALARADAGQRTPSRPVDLVAAAHAAVARLPDTPGPATEIVAPSPAGVAASPAEVDLVLDNLLGNAWRHGRSLIRIAVLPAGRWVRLVVDDDGPGIPEADRVRVFDRFTRLAPEAGAGAGLGLALVAALVAGRGGTVFAASSPEGGARLEARWPAPAPGPAPEASAADRAPRPTRPA